MKAIAFFDFDGTITTNDSLAQFIRFIVGDVKFAAGLVALSPLLMLYKLRIIPNDRAKQAVLRWYIKGMPREQFMEQATRFSLTKIDRNVRPKAKQRIQWHLQQGHKVVVVSASLACWLRPWCTQQQLELLATEIDTSQPTIMGQFTSANCYGAEKVRRIYAAYPLLAEYDTIYAYGDSRGDREMLALADHAAYKPFR